MEGKPPWENRRKWRPSPSVRGEHGGSTYKFGGDFTIDPWGLPGGGVGKDIRLGVRACKLGDSFIKVSVWNIAFAFLILTMVH